MRKTLLLAGTVLLALATATRVATISPLYVSLSSAAEPTLSLRHCSYQAYVTQRSGASADFLWELVDLGANKVALRPAAFTSLLLCSLDGSDLTLEALPASAPQCTFTRVSGLTGSNHLTLMMGSKYLSVLGALDGSCAQNLRAPESSVGLVASPSKAAATWIATTSSVVTLTHTLNSQQSISVRHCNYVAFATPVDSVADDFKWIVEKAVDGGDGVSLRSYNFPQLHLGLVEGSRTRLGAVRCSARPGDCSFIRGNSDTGAMTLFLKSAGKYVALGRTLTTGLVGCKFAAPSVDLALDDVPTRWEINAVAAAPRTASLQINFAGDGGLYAELIRNRDFEALGRGDLGDGRRDVNPNTKDFRPWTWQTLAGTASVATDFTTQPFQTNPAVLSVQLGASSSAQLRNPGFWGINCRKGMSYSGSVYVRSTTNARLVASLVVDGSAVSTSAVVTSKPGCWKKYEFSFDGIVDRPDAAFSLTVEADKSGTVWLDSVSLVPGDAVMGLFRKDVFDYVLGLKPSFVRFPGGNYLEGNTMETHWDWKKSLGDPASRPGHYNDAWGYWTTDGLGMHEYLLFCELLNSKPQLSVFTGYFLTRRYIPIEQSDQFIYDALDAIEYANGDVHTPYGRMRVAAGHPASFNMDRVEVGNEEALQDEYRTHYNNITRGIWSRHPEMQVVASGWWGPDMKGNPCLSGSRCDAWDEHYYREPDTMAAMSTWYDRYDRRLPPVFVGEYAGADFTKESPESIQQAVSEAAFMIGFERNADIVVQSSFAPLFRHTQGTQWRYDMICYNSSAIYAMPAYDVQRLFRVEQCDHTLESVFSGPESAGRITSVACVQQTGSVVVKVVNYGATDLVVDVDLSAFGHSGHRARLVTLESATPFAANDLDNPHFVQSAETYATFEGSHASLAMPPYSLVIAIF
eukprot:m51a1_g3217 putative alpha-l-arabinofuranosidase-like (916) ;mRNA; f:46537-49787